jgi:HAD superfamily hydrolase (TIGR01509 family)
MTGNFKALIFDMDGTLVDNMHYHQAAWIGFLEKHGVFITPEEFNRKNHGIISEIVPRFFDRSLQETEIATLGAEKEGFYRELYAPHLKPVEGLLSFLEKLRSQGIKIGLATAADRPNIDFTIDGLQIRKYFTAITGGEEVNYGKPDPEVYLLTARKLELDPVHCLVVEDSETGIKSGLAAGMQVMAITTTHRAEELNGYPLYKVIENYTGL